MSTKYLISLFGKKLLARLIFSLVKSLVVGLVNITCSPKNKPWLVCLIKVPILAFTVYVFESCCK